MFQLWEMDEQHFDYTIALEYLKREVIVDGLKVSANAVEIFDFIKDLDLTHYKIYYYLSLQGMSDDKIKLRLAKDIAECEVW